MPSIGPITKPAHDIHFDPGVNQFQRGNSTAAVPPFVHSADHLHVLLRHQPQYSAGPERWEERWDLGETG
jgi:hypothetical protein